MGYCEAWISGLGGEESHWVMRHWVGLKEVVLATCGFRSWFGLGWVRWAEKWEVKETREWVGVRGSGGFVEVGERKALEGSGNGGYHVVCLFVCLTLALFRSVFGRGELCLIIGSGV